MEEEKLDKKVYKIKNPNFLTRLFFSDFSELDLKDCADEYVILARKHFRDKDKNSRLRCYNKAALLYEESKNYFHAGDCYFEINLYEESLRCYLNSNTTCNHSIIKTLEKMLEKNDDIELINTIIDYCEISHNKYKLKKYNILKGKILMINLNFKDSIDIIENHLDDKLSVYYYCLNLLALDLKNIVEFYNIFNDLPKEFIDLVNLIEDLTLDYICLEQILDKIQDKSLIPVYKYIFEKFEKSIVNIC